MLVWIHVSEGDIEVLRLVVIIRDMLALRIKARCHYGRIPGCVYVVMLPRQPCNQVSYAYVRFAMATI